MVRSGDFFVGVLYRVGVGSGLPRRESHWIKGGLVTTPWYTLEPKKLAALERCPNDIGQRDRFYCNWLHVLATSDVGLLFCA